MSEPEVDLTEIATRIESRGNAVTASEWKAWTRRLLGLPSWAPPSPGEHESDPPFNRDLWTRTGVTPWANPDHYSEFARARSWSRTNAQRAHS